MKTEFGSQNYLKLGLLLKVYSTGVLSKYQFVWQNLVADGGHLSQKYKKFLVLPIPEALQLFSS